MAHSVDSDFDFQLKSELLNLPRADQREPYTQSSHGFAVGKVVVLTGSGWVLADAAQITHRYKLGGVVAAVIDTNNFVVTHRGKVGGFSSLTVGAEQFTSTTTGGVSTTWSNRRVGVAVSDTQIFVDMGMPGGAGLIAKQTASSSAALTFDGVFTDDFRTYEVKFVDIAPASDGVDFEISLRDSSSDASGTYRFGNRAEQIGGTTSIHQNGASNQIIANVGSSTNEEVTGILTIWPRGSTYKRWIYHTNKDNSSGNIFSEAGGGILENTTAMSGVKFAFSSGNIASGSIEIYALG